MTAARPVLVAILLALGNSPAFAQPADPAPLEVVRTANLPYRTDPSADPVRHRLDVYAPKDRTNFPVIVFVHGGTWQSGSKALYGGVGSTFARAGVGVVVINYRLTPKVVHPGHVEDVARAFAWTREHIAEYGGDPTKVFLMGHSAGGHLVALLATDPAYLAAEGRGVKDVRGVVSVSGVYEIVSTEPVFHAAFGRDREKCERASPLYNVSGNHPPFLLAYADADYAHLDEMALEFNCALGRCRSPATLVKVKSRNHYTIIMNVVHDDDPLRLATLAFVARHGS